MSIFRNLFQKKHNDKSLQSALLQMQGKFKNFMSILESNNKVLKLISDLEEKSQGDYLFDINYLKKSVNEIKLDSTDIIDNLVMLGGNQYLPLKEINNGIFNLLDDILSRKTRIIRDDYCKSFNLIGNSDIPGFGGKNARMGELTSKLNLPVPEGFAISAWAYKSFIDKHDLSTKISDKIKQVDIKNFGDLKKVSQEVEELILNSPLPEDLSDNIMQFYNELTSGRQDYFVSIRSSALGEDTELSFAGQYASFLGVSENELLDSYKKVLASKFSPNAIYYYLSHNLDESELAMSVGCVKMINARISGVIYTHDPVKPDDNCMVVNSIYGLGQYLVDGTVTPDIVRISRKDNSIISTDINPKTSRLVMKQDGVLNHENIPKAEQDLISITENELAILIDFAVKIEKHYGEPQDIEWVIDKHGQPFILQTRPLRLIKASPRKQMPDISGFQLLASGGTTVCPGGGYGKVKHIKSSADLDKVSQGDVVIARNPFPGLVTVLGKINALIAVIGSVASHLATIAREYRIPAVVGMKEAGAIEEGTTITVDAGTCRVYRGNLDELVEAIQPEFDFFDGDPLFNVLKKLLRNLSPLNLIHPLNDDFIIANCKTIHDITRFAHQKSMDEMFKGADMIKKDDWVGIRLKSSIPIHVEIIYIDKELSAMPKKRVIKPEQIDCLPMKAFWDGVIQEGWPKPPPIKTKGFVSVVANAKAKQPKGEFGKKFGKKSFAVLSKEFMILSLKMGYHFITYEAMCSDVISKNYIKMQFKEGGASVDRRIRRIKLITKVLEYFGFDNSTKGDFLDTSVSYESKESILEKLRILGRLTMLTKQLDMAMSNDSIADFYTQDILRKLKQ
ncbi:PEP/pyruvate-binding domain-containing protein [Desulfococcaceae bacterium HSG9]|nr:PEP/pyruvate-binding domain-containing protein [Desulfococcaceae bacterium HSG9]